MKIGAGLRVTSENLQHISKLPIDFIVPYCNRNVVRINQLAIALPHLTLIGETLLSPHYFNNRYLWEYYAHLRNHTKLETERYILRDILQKMERRSPFIKQWEIFNELVKDNGSYRKCEKHELWDREFYAQVIKEVRSLFPHYTLMYSDYNFPYPQKETAIATLVDELGLDGVCMQFHLSIASINWLRYIPTSRFENCVSYYQKKGKKIVVSEAGIRLNMPSITAMAGEKMLRDGNLIKDLIQYKGMDILPVTLKRQLGNALWRSLIHRCQELGVDEFYCFKDDSCFERDEPSLIDKDFNWKLEQ